MRRIKIFLCLYITLLAALTTKTQAQLWSGVIASNRATDWTGTGVVGGIPSSWTQCGATIAAYTGTADTINTALAACGANQYVQLGAGSFNLSTGIDYNHKSNIALKGTGPGLQSIINFGASAFVNCSGFQANICDYSSDTSYSGSPGTVVDWTAHYAKGTTVLTYSGVTGISANATIVVNDQCETGYSGGSSCPTGANIDNGGFFDCDQKYAVTPTGCAVSGPDNSNRLLRPQSEFSMVTSVVGNDVTLQSPLKNPNWALAQSTQSYHFTPIQNVGLEQVLINSVATSASAAVHFFNAYNVWVRRVAVLNALTWGVNCLDCVHFTFQQNYFYGFRGPDPYGIRLSASSDGLVESNICQQVRSCTVPDGPDTGTVFAYNFAIHDSTTSDDMHCAFWTHSGGTNYELFEGNIGPCIYNDDEHGSHMMNTKFRNRLQGWELFVPAKDFATNPMFDIAYNRYTNNIFNILGTTGYHTIYQSTSVPTSNLAIYAIGNGNGATSPPVPTDAFTLTSMFRWGNCDSVTGYGACKFDSSEVPTGIAGYPNSVPATHNANPSFYLSSRPIWWSSSIPFPAIGPDVSGGNMGTCSGGTYDKVDGLTNANCPGGTLATGMGGHVNATPAAYCYYHYMNGTTDGSGSALTFNPDDCYSGTAGTIDMLAWMVPTQIYRDNYHMEPAVAHHNNPTYTELTTNWYAWIKGSGGYPWDINWITSDFIYFGITEQTFSVPTTYKIKNDQSGSGNALLEVKFAARFPTTGYPGTVLYSYPTTSEIHLDCTTPPTTFNIGHVHTDTMGPYVESLGGTLPDNSIDYQQWYYWSCDASYNNCATLEKFTFMYPYGKVRWTTSHLSGGVYIQDQESDFNQLTAGAGVKVNFPCGGLPVDVDPPSGLGVVIK